MFELEIKPKAEKNLLQIPSLYQEKISKAIDKLAINPYIGGSEKLIKKRKLTKI